ncbi:hypothetical protein J4P59_003770, partial [Acinetobacter baumannii]
HIRPFKQLRVTKNVNSWPRTLKPEVRRKVVRTTIYIKNRIFQGLILSNRTCGKLRLGVIVFKTLANVD